MLRASNFQQNVSLINFIAKNSITVIGLSSKASDNLAEGVTLALYRQGHVRDDENMGSERLLAPWVCLEHRRRDLSNFRHDLVVVHLEFLHDLALELPLGWLRQHQHATGRPFGGASSCKILTPTGGK